MAGMDISTVGAWILGGLGAWALAGTGTALVLGRVIGRRDLNG